MTSFLYLSIQRPGGEVGRVLVAQHRTEENGKADILLHTAYPFLLSLFPHPLREDFPADPKAAGITVIE